MPTAKVPKKLCIICKGYRHLCGLSYCPILASLAGRLKAYVRVRGRSVDGASPPTVIVGESGYPKVKVYVGVPPGVFGSEAKFFDSPDDWHMKLSLRDIIELRARLIHTFTSVDVRKPEELYDKEVALAGVSLKPVDLEAQLAKPPKPIITFNPLIPPSGPPAPAQHLKVVDNPQLHPKLESLIWDDVKASEAAWILYSSGLDFYTIVRALTLGLLGRRRARRAVPTRWGITAIDSIITSKLLSAVRASPTINTIEVYHASYLHNKYTVILIPGRYSSRWLEVWRPRSLWNPSTDAAVWEVSDDFKGNLTHMDGGFIAAREPVVEYLARRRRQARIVILREIEPDYIYPAGSWQIRLTVKYALSKGAVLRNPTPAELADFINRVHDIPSRVTGKVLDYVYRVRNKSLLDFM